MSYETALKNESLLINKQYKVFIADEAHYLKSYNTKRTKALMPILMNSKRVILLSGTPIINKPLEIYNLIKIVRPDITPLFPEYASRYCDPKQESYGIDYSGSSCLKELNYLLTSSIMIRRFKSDVLSQLPPKLRQKIQIKVDPKLLLKIRSIISKLFVSEKELENAINVMQKSNNIIPDSDEEEKESSSFFSAYKLTGMSKVAGVEDFIGSLIENGTKFIVFAHH